MLEVISERQHCKYIYLFQGLVVHEIVGIFRQIELTLCQILAVLHDIFFVGR